MAKLGWNKFVESKGQAYCIAAALIGIRPSGALVEDGRKLPSDYELLLEKCKSIFQGDWAVRKIGKGKCVNLLVRDKADVTRLNLEFPLSPTSAPGFPEFCEKAFTFNYRDADFKRMLEEFSYYVPKSSALPATVQSLPAKIAQYVTIGSGLATVIKTVWDLVQSVSGTGRREILAEPCAFELQQLANDVEANADAARDRFAHWWDTDLPDSVKRAIGTFVDSSGDEQALKQLHYDLFCAVMDDFDNRHVARLRLSESGHG
jgi:hypothetical protein